ncbi:glycosyltransferase family protein [Bhargavaea beijingensis]|uniref:hypothetical protein n=1 Tax=Bhargavaea beijingensis TaxID=426756 RepID=UPI002225AC7B|nr:hypothetical protein [Bhargavaea beijingensis]MCW1929092.1 hypothetical protein [Bhargavaea beijingensis]
MKNKMNLLLVTSNPIENTNSAMISNINIIKGLVENGHSITIVSFKSPLSNTSNYIDPILKRVKIIRVDSSQEYKNLISKSENKINNVFKKRILKYARFIYHKFGLFDHYKKAVIDMKSINLDNNYDAMISFSDPKSSHLLAERIKKENKGKIKKWIQHWGDPMTIDISRKSTLPMSYVRRVEKNVLEKSDHVIYVSPLTLIKQRELFPDISTKFSFIPLPYYQVKESKQLNHNGKIKVGYFGNYNSKIRDISPLYNSFRKASNIFEFKIVGDTDLNLETTGNTSVISKRVSYLEVTNMEEKVDVLVVILNKKGTQIPGKLYYYAATNKPILVIYNESQREIVSFFERFDRFTFCLNDENEILKTINSILRNSNEYKSLEEFSPKSIADEIEKVINNEENN